MKSRLRAVESVIQNGNSYGVLVTKFEGISPCKKPGHGREDSISAHKSSTHPLSYLTTIQGHYARKLA